MKRFAQALSIVATALLVLICSGFDYPPTIFGAKLDSAWREGREAEIPGMIEARLAEKPGNPLALLCGYYYYCSVIPDREKKLAYRTKIEIKISEFISASEEKIDPKEIDEFTQFVFLESNTQADVESTNGNFISVADLKRIWPNEFPFRSTAEMNAKIIGHYDHEYAMELAECHKAWQQKKLAILNEIGLDKLKADTLQFIETSGESSKESEDKWPETFKRLAPVVVSAGSNSVCFGFWKMGGVYDGVVVYFDETDPREWPNNGYISTYEKLADYIFWHYSRN